MPEPSSLAGQQLQLVRDAILRGGVIAYPTEAVWGLGCDPWNCQAVTRILALKNRPVEKGLILVAASVEQVRFLLEPLPESVQKEARSYWPGPVTCLLPDVNKQIPDWVRGDHSSIAVRVSEHPVVKALCETTDMPLISTSCNPAGQKPALNAQQILGYFDGQLDQIVPGDLGGNQKPSRIIDIVSGKQLR